MKITNNLVDELRDCQVIFDSGRGEEIGIIDSFGISAYTGPSHMDSLNWIETLTETIEGKREIELRVGILIVGRGIQKLDDVISINCDPEKPITKFYITPKTKAFIK